MGRNVKLQDTGEIVKSENAYRAENKKYYSSEEAYRGIIKNKENRELCILHLMNVLGYDNPQMKLPTVTYKKLSELDVYGYDVVLETIKAHEKDITWALDNKQFTSETAKIFYIMAIIQNNVMTEYKRKVAESRAKKKTEEVVVVEEIVTKQQKSHDIAKWLEDDDE